MLSRGPGVVCALKTAAWLPHPDWASGIWGVEKVGGWEPGGAEGIPGGGRAPQKSGEKVPPLALRDFLLPESFPVPGPGPAKLSYQILPVGAGGYLALLTAATGHQGAGEQPQAPGTDSGLIACPLCGLGALFWGLSFSPCQTGLMPSA